MTNLSDRYNTDLSKLIISDNIQALAESIVICALKNFLPYKPFLAKLYFGLIRDIQRKDNISRSRTDTISFRPPLASSLDTSAKFSAIRLWENIKSP